MLRLQCINEVRPSCDKAAKLRKTSCTRRVTQALLKPSHAKTKSHQARSRQGRSAPNQVTPSQPERHPELTTGTGCQLFHPYTRVQTLDLHSAEQWHGPRRRLRKKAVTRSVPVARGGRETGGRTTERVPTLHYLPASRPSLRVLRRCSSTA